MQIFAIVVSLAITAFAVVAFAKAIGQITGVVRAGQPLDRSDQGGRRLANMFKETLVHTRMLQWHWVGVLHWFAFSAFIVLSSAVGQAYFQLFKADFAWPLIGHWIVYEWVAEFLGLLGALAIIPLVIYRLRNRPETKGRQSRFFGSTMWQAYFVEAMVFIESSAILFIRGAEFKYLEHAEAAHFPISRLFSGLWPDSQSGLANVIYAIAMFKIVSAMVWLIVISRNITMGVAWHRFTAWFNIYYKRDAAGGTALGALKPLMNNGKPMTLDDLDDLDEESVLGVGKIEDFSWKGILDFTTCTECGRCQSQCPAWNTEKPLSPKLLMMGLREHAYAKVGAGDQAHTERALIGSGDDQDWFYNPEGGDFVIDEDVLWSCTSCGACVQQCPVDIEHVDHIVDMRRYQVLVESNFPAELNQLFKGLESRGNPWNMSPTGRMDWAKGLPFEVKEVGKDLEDLESVEWLFWVGCAGAYEDRAKKTTQAVAELLNMAGVTFGVLGNGETCTGDSARRAGNEFVFQGLAQQNVETFKEFKVKKVVSTCAHCFNTLKNEYREFGIELEVVHHTQLLNRLVREGKLTPIADGAGAAKRSITYHDPCYLGRHNQVYAPPRELLQVLPGAQVVEMERNSERSFCCGAGGARMWMEETLGERINLNRTAEAVGTGADQVAVGCPFCRVMLADGLTSLQAQGGAREEVEVLDVAQMLLASVKGESATRTRKPGTSTAAGEAPGAGAAIPGAAATGAAAAAGTAGAAAAGAAAAGTAADSVPDSAPGSAPDSAAASTGGSLFGAEESANDSGSLFGSEPAGGSLFAETPATAEPTASSSSLFDEQPSGSLFDEAPAATAEPSSGSLFDEQPSGSLFDEIPAATAEPATPAEPTAASGGSLFDEQPSGSLFDTPATPAQPTAASGGSLFDTPEAEPAVPPPATPAAEVPSGSSGSLFDVAEDPAPANPEPASPESAGPESANPEPANPAVPTGTTPGADLDLSGSLFDVPDAAATSSQTGSPAAAAPTSDSPASDTASGPLTPTPADSDSGSGQDLDLSGSLFDVPDAAAVEPAPAEPTSARADEPISAPSADSATAAPTAEGGRELDFSGSLFDVPEAEAVTTEPTAPTAVSAPPATEPAASDTQPGDTQPGDEQPGDTQPGDEQPGDTQPGDTQPGDEQPSDEQSAEEQPVEEQPTEATGASESTVTPHEVGNKELPEGGSLFDL